MGRIQKALTRYCKDDILDWATTGVPADMYSPFDGLGKESYASLAEYASGKIAVLRKKHAPATA